MPGKHTEAVFEESIVADLVAHRGWSEGTAADFDRQLALAPKDLNAFSLVMRQKISDLMVERMEQNQDIVTKYLGEKDFQDIAFRALVKAIYEDIRRQPGL